ncbi:MAG TPA: glycosyltransferase family 4 protein [Chthoniobacterales bacterium]|nr:glycosyltransferase family 4 protein [Chthoniobacterales bacterium]
MISVNVCAEGEEWLFGDIKKRFAATRVPGLRVTVSDRPERGADAWVFIRTREAVRSPDLSRSVVCLHDLFEQDGHYLPGGDRAAVRSAGALALCHPEQRRILRDAGITLEGVPVLERPLGALEIFQPRTVLQERFHLGWVGRDHWRKRPEWVPEIADRLVAEGLFFRVVLVGKNLDSLAAEMAGLGIECALYERADYPIETYPQLYAKMDCLLITSITEAGPLPLFEALATGVPVVTTPVGWAPHFAARAPEFIRLGECPAELAANVASLYRERREMFDRRHDIAALAATPRLDSWCGDVLDLAAVVARGNRNAPAKSPR